MQNFPHGYCDFIGPASVGGIEVELEDYPGLLPWGDPKARVEGYLDRRIKC